MNIGQLREVIKNLPADMRVVTQFAEGEPKAEVRSVLMVRVGELKLSGTLLGGFPTILWVDTGDG